MNFLKKLNKGIKRQLIGLFGNPYKRVGLSWIKVKKLKHLSAGKLRQTSFLQSKISFYDPFEFLEGVKEIFIHEIYKQEFKPAALIIDCGANIGLSILYLKGMFPDAHVIAFEPDSKNYQLLEANMKMQKMQGVELRKEAVWIENTYLTFEEEGSMSSKINMDGNTFTGSKKVKAIRLREILSQSVDFLKLDIEGAEYEVIKDIRDELNLVKNLFIEYHGTFQQQSQLEEIFQIISSAGFHYYIKEAANVYPTPLFKHNTQGSYDIQLNIFCFRE